MVQPIIEVMYINPTILRETECKRQVDTPSYILGIGLILYECMYEWSNSIHTFMQSFRVDGHEFSLGIVFAFFGRETKFWKKTSQVTCWYVNESDTEDTNGIVICMHNTYHVVPKFVFDIWTPCSM